MTALLGALAAPVLAQGWQEWSPAPEPRYGHAMAYDSARGRVVMFGGGCGSGTRSAIWEHDGTSWTERALPGGPGPRFGVAMAFDSARGRTVVFGGSGSDQTWEYDGAAWIRGPAAPAGMAGRQDHAMAFDSSRGVTVLFGGINATSMLNDTWEYDGTTWTPGPAAPTWLVPRYRHAMAYDPVRRATVLFGGTQGGSPIDDTWEYRGSAWTAGPSGSGTPKGRDGHAMAFDPVSQKVVLVGGHKFFNPSIVGDTWEFDGAWTQRNGSVPARTRHAMAWDTQAGRMVLFGGQYGSTCYGDTWINGGAYWQQLLPSTGPRPPARAYFAIAHDDLRGVTIVHGGSAYSGGAPFSDTWELGASGWTQGPSIPPYGNRRTGHAMAYDSRRHRVVLFGGYDGTDDRDEVWEYDGVAWTPGAATWPRPSPRSGHGMAFDAARGRAVVSLGYSRRNYTFANDTWEFDGTRWYLAPLSPGPSPRAGHAFAYDPVRKVTVLFGGWVTTANLNDTWEYDGAWRPGADSSALPALAEGAMAADPTRGVMILYGGRTATWANLDVQWEYDGQRWLRATPAPPRPGPRHGHRMVADGAIGRVVLFGGYDTTARDDTWTYVGATRPHDDYLVGAGLGQPNPNLVRILDPAGVPVTDILAYAAGWGANVAAGRIDGSATASVLTGPGPGPTLGPQVRAFDRDGAAVAKVNFYAYGTLRYGANVAAGKADGDAFAEIATTPGAGTVFGPHVRAFDYDGGAISAVAKISFFAYASLSYGAVVSTGELDADGFDELLTAPGPGPRLAPQVRGWNVDGAGPAAIAGINFFAFPVAQYGARVAAGDPDADGYDEAVCAPGAGPTASFPGRLRGFDYDGATLATLAGFDVTAFPTYYGASAGLGDLDDRNADQLVAGAGPDPAADSRLRVYAYSGAALTQLPVFVFGFQGTSFGVNATAGAFGY